MCIKKIFPIIKILNDRKRLRLTYAVKKVSHFLIPPIRSREKVEGARHIRVPSLADGQSTKQAAAARKGRRSFLSKPFCFFIW